MKKSYFFAGGYTESMQMASGETVPGRCKGITAFGFDEETGKLERMAVASSVPNPSYITADSKGPYLYCVNELKEYYGVEGALASAYEICPQTGGLRLINSQFTCGADPCYVCLSPDGRYLLAANYSGGSICVFPILENHGLGHAACVLRHQGSGVNPERQKEPHPHQILPSPDGRHVYVPDLGLDRLACYEADWERGWLRAAEGRDIPGRPGQGLRHGVFDRSGTRLYVMTEMACEVNVYAFAKETGEARLLQALSALPEDCRTSCLGAAIRLHPNGRWLYVSVRGGNHLAAFGICGDGTLELMGIQPSGGEIPRDFVISSNGKYLLAAHQDTDTICVFGIDSATGALELVDTNREAFCTTVLAPWQCDG